MVASPMTEQRIIAVFDSYAGLIHASRARLAEIGMTYDTLDQIAGWCDSYSTKILSVEPPTAKQSGKRSTRRRLGVQSLGELTGGLGVKLAFVDDPERLERIKNHPEFRLRKWTPGKASIKASIAAKHWLFTPEKARQMGVLRGQKTSQKRRRAIAKKAAKARWKKPRVVEIKNAACDASAPHGATPAPCARPAPSPDRSRAGHTTDGRAVSKHHTK